MWGVWDGSRSPLDARNSRSSGEPGARVWLSFFGFVARDARVSEIHTYPETSVAENEGGLLMGLFFVGARSTPTVLKSTEEGIGSN